MQFPRIPCLTLAWASLFLAVPVTLAADTALRRTSRAGVSQTPAADFLAERDEAPARRLAEIRSATRLAPEGIRRVATAPFDMAGEEHADAMMPVSGGSESQLPGVRIDLDEYEDAHGLATVYTDPRNGMDLILDITDMVQPSNRDGYREGFFLVTAIANKGTYIDGIGQVSIRHEPLEETMLPMFKFQLSQDARYVDVLQPQLGMRTSDPQTNNAYRVGANSSWLTRVSRMMTNRPPNRIIIDGIELIQQGFFVAPTLMSTMSTYQVTEVANFPGNFDITVDFLNGAAVPHSVTFGIAVLPDEPMEARAFDDRLPYFTTEYIDLGVHLNEPGTVADFNPHTDIDTSVKIIQRYNLDKLPGNELRFYVDPSVPPRWRESFRQGIEIWNEAFVLVGRPRVMRAILPQDPEWPDDYNAGDLRFNSITWSIDRDEIFSIGVSKVDPRSGEVLKSNVVMTDGWVRSWLDELDDMSLSRHSALETQASRGFRREAYIPQDGAAAGSSTPWWAEVEFDSHQVAAPAKAPSAVRGGRPPLPRAGDWKASARVRRRKNGPRQATRRTTSLLGQNPRGLITAGVPYSQWEAAAAAGLMSVVTHEVGHALGLRHNFKGSVGVSYECTQDMSCTAVQGLTASAMDYMSINLPAEVDRTVHLFSPTIGAYDKLAIIYGYKAVPSQAFGGPPQVPSQLEGLLRQAEGQPSCSDQEHIMAVDPLCQMYDVSSDPLRYHDAVLRNIAKLQTTFLNRSVEDGEAYWHYGQVVEAVQNRLSRTQQDVLNFLGGINASHAHRSPNPSQVVPAIPAQDQRRALQLILRTLRPRAEKLLPPKEDLPFLVIRDLDESVRTTDLDEFVQLRQLSMMQHLLKTNRLARIAGSEATGGLGLADFLTDLSFGVLGPADGEELVKSQPGEDFGLQEHYVATLRKVRDIVSGSTDAQNVQPTLALQVDIAFQQARDTVRNALQRGNWGDPKEPDWNFCAVEGGRCHCDGRVRFGLEPRWSGIKQISTAMKCSTAEFGDPSPNATKVCECYRDVGFETRDLRYAHLQLLERVLNGKAGELVGALAEEPTSQSASLWLLFMGAGLVLIAAISSVLVVKCVAT